MIIILQLVKMGRKRVKGTKYNKISKQQKYIFLKLCISEKKNIQEAAFEAGIHYSTAKTILFFHKKHYKNYTQFEVSNKQPQGSQILRATYSPILIHLDSENNTCPRIEIFSTTSQGGKFKKKISSSSTQSVKQQEFSDDFMKMQDEHPKRNQIISFFTNTQNRNFGRERWRENDDLMN